MRTPLPPVIEESLSVVDSQCINFLHVQDAKLLGDYIASKAKKSLLEERKSLIIISDDTEPETILQSLSTERLAHFACKWDSANPLSKKLIERFRILTTLSEVPRSRHAYQHINSYTKAYHEELMKNIGNINKRTASGLTIKESLAIQGLRQRHSLTTSQFDFFKSLETSELFYSLLGDLETKYLLRFRNLTLDRFDDHIYSSKSKFFESKKTIDSLVNHVALIQQEIATLSISLLEDLNQKIDEELRILNEVLDELRELYFTHDFEQQDNVSQLISAVISRTDTFNYLALDYNLGTANSMHDLDIIIKWVDKTIEYQNDLRIKLERQNFSRFTPFNIDRQEWLTLSTHVDELCEELKKAHFISIEINDRPLTLNALKTDVDNAKGKLIQIQSILLDQDFTDFKLLQNELKLSNEIINLIDSVEELNWVNSVDLFCQEVMIKKHLKIGGGESYSSYHKLNDLNEKKEEIISDSIHNSWIKKRKEAIGLFQSNHKETCQLLLSSVIKEMTLSNLFFLDPNFVSTYFPITVIRESELLEVETINAAWDDIIYLDIAKVSINPMQEFIAAGKEVSLATTKNVDPKPIQSINEMQLFMSKEEKLIYGQPFSLLQNSERLHQAKSLSIALNGVSQSFSVYQLKTKSIISFAHKAITHKLLDFLPSEEINVLYADSKNVDDLIDAMIPIDREIIMIYENGLINDKKLQSISWQMHILKLLEESGVTLIDINTIDLAKNYRFYMKGIMKKINNVYVSHRENELVLS